MFPPQNSSVGGPAPLCWEQNGSAWATAETLAKEDTERGAAPGDDVCLSPAQLPWARGPWEAAEGRQQKSL